MNPMYYLMPQNMFLKVGIILTLISQTVGFIMMVLNNSKYLLYFLNYRHFKIQSTENKNKILKEIINFYCYTYSENFEPLNRVVDKKHWIPKYFIHGISDDNYETIEIFCTKETLQELLKGSTENKRQEIELDENFLPCKKATSYIEGSDDDERYESDSDDDVFDLKPETDELGRRKNKFVYITCGTTYGALVPNCRKVYLENIGPTEFNDYQTEAFKSIMTFYKERHFCKVFINGPPGKGKTYFSYLMANKLNCFLTDNYCPTDPGSNFNTIYNRFKTTLTKPLILVLDEVDIILDKIHNNKLTFHKSFRREICDKPSWNKFIDKFEYGLFPNTILIMTSNKTRQELDKLDKSYLRDGRINLTMNWN